MSPTTPQAEFDLHAPEAMWRSGRGLRPYIKDAQKLLIRCAAVRLMIRWGGGMGCRLCMHRSCAGGAYYLALRCDHQNAGRNLVYPMRARNRKSVHRDPAMHRAMHRDPAISAS